MFSALILHNFYSEHVSDFVMCPIRNFTAESNIEFEYGIAIRKITQDEFHSLVEADENSGNELRAYPESVVYLPNDEWQVNLTKVLTSLRLIAKERVGVARTYCGYALPSRPWRILDTVPGTSFLRRESDKGLLTLGDSQSRQLKHLFSLVDKSGDSGYLAVSMSRFNLAYERATLEDSWIDFFISLESLFSKQSELTEVTHRLATRISRVLADSVQEKKKLATKIKKWYKTRSEIVHGINVDVKEQELQDLEEIVRRSVLWFVGSENSADHDQVIDWIDLS